MFLTGCKARSELNGEYVIAEGYGSYLEHDLPVYRKKGDKDDVFVYFWDAGEDHPDSTGWYLAGEVGSEEVLGFNPEKTSFPPQTGWRIREVSSMELESDTCSFAPPPIVEAASVPAEQANSAADAAQQVSEQAANEGSTTLEVTAEEKGACGAASDIADEAGQEKAAAQEVVLQDVTAEPILQNVAQEHNFQTVDLKRVERGITKERTEDSQKLLEVPVAEVTPSSQLPVETCDRQKEEPVAVDVSAERHQDKQTVQQVKKPVGGAYGVFQNEMRSEFAKQATAAGEKGFGSVAKLASAAWKALPEEDKLKYETRYKLAMEKYRHYHTEAKQAVATSTEGKEAPASSPAGKAKRGKPSAVAGSEMTPAAKRPRKGKDEKATPDAATPSAAKRSRPEAAAAPNNNGTPVKRSLGHKPKTGQKLCGYLSASILAEADKHGLKAALENLAARPEIVAKGIVGDTLLSELVKTGGLVNKAKASLLRA